MRTKEMTKERKRDPSPSMNGKRLLFPTPSSSVAPSPSDSAFLLFPLPAPRFRHLAPRVFLWLEQSPHICSREEV